MDETYRSLGRDRELELLREAERLHRGTRARAARRARHPSPRPLLDVARLALRRRLRRAGESLRVARRPA